MQSPFCVPFGEVNFALSYLDHGSTDSGDFVI